jgi:hypothetical protein
MAHIAQAIQKKQVVVDYADKEHWPRFTPEDRLRLYRKCGKSCFAKPVTASAQEILANPKKLAFPVCRVPPPKSRTCKVSASGLLAASRRARLTKKYPEILSETSELIRKLGTTNVARKEMEIRRVRVEEKPLPDGKHVLTIVYTNGVEKKVPYTKRHILKKYGDLLSKALYKRLSASL